MNRKISAMLKPNRHESPPRLLEQKLVAPHPPVGMLERSDLFEKLLRVSTQRVVLISAPAGYGKTSLMCKFHKHLQDSDANTFWLSLDESDNDPSRLRLYLRAALTPACCWEEQPSLTMHYESIVACTMFIDDLHVLREPAAEVLRELLSEMLPPQVKFVLGSRNSHALKLSTLRNKGRLIDIDRSDLSFSLSDTSVYLKSQLSEIANDSFIQAVHRQTEGWPAALQMICVSLRHRGVRDASQIEKMLPDLQGMASFLTDEIFRVQPTEVQRFLLSVAVVDQFSASLCSVLTDGGTDNNAMIERIFSAGIPIHQLDAHWFRLHPLFAEHIKATSRRCDPYRFSLNGKVAAAWLVADGRSIEAVEALLACENYVEAVLLIERLARQLVINGQCRTVMRWCERLQIDMVLSSPILCSAYTVCLGMCNQVQKTIQWMKYCIDSSKKKNADRLYADTVLFIRVYGLVSRGESAQLAEVVPILDEVIKERVHISYGSFLNLRAYVHLAAGEYVAAERCNLAAKRVFRNEGHNVGIASTLYIEAISAATQGRIRDAISYLETVSSVNDVVDMNNNDLVELVCSAVTYGGVVPLEIMQTLREKGHQAWALHRAQQQITRICAGEI